MSLILVISCERDDICIEDIQESPDLIILMLDIENKTERKVPLGFSILAIGNSEEILESLIKISFLLLLVIF